MEFYEALEVMKRGEEVQHAGRTYKILHRGIFDVTNPDEPERVQLTAELWGDEPELVDPETVDEALNETIPETLGTLDTEIDRSRDHEEPL